MSERPSVLTIKGGSNVRYTAQETLDVTFEGQDLSIQLTLEPDDLAPLFDGAAWAGTQLWDAAICMIEFLAQNHRDQFVPSNTVLELGAGTGLPAMCCHLMGARAVITEQPQLVPLQQSNIQRNFPDDANICALPLSWGREATIEFVEKEGPFQIVIACDCIFAPLYGDSWRYLADSIHVLLERPTTVPKGTLVLLSVERRNGDQLERFFEYGMALTPRMNFIEVFASGKIMIYEVRLF